MNTRHDDTKIKCKLFADADGRGSKPIVIAKVILTAYTAAHPKTRYAAGFGSKPILFFRKVVTDKMYDKFFLGMMNNVK